MNIKHIARSQLKFGLLRQQTQGEGYVALCPEVDVASQGTSVAEASDNLAEALALFFESAPAEEVDQRLRGEVYVTQIEVAVG